MPEAAVTADEPEAVFSARGGEVHRGEVELRDGLSARGFVGHHDPLVRSDVLRELARSCVVSALSLWARVMVVRYLEQSDSDFLTDLSLELRQATLASSTALAGAFQDADGSANPSRDTNGS